MSPSPSSRFSPHTLTRGGLRLRRFVRRFLYAQLSFRDGLLILLGKADPLVRFTVEADPPSVYVMWRIRSEDVEALPARLGFPSEIRLQPLRCFEGDAPEHLLTLNVYRVSGLANGLRAEWSVYVRDPRDGISRYMVIDAVSSTGTIDPVNLLVKRSPICEYARDGDRLAFTLSASLEEGRDVTRARFEIPRDATRVRLHPDFVTANDLIYWANGIADKVYYDGTMADGPVIPVDPAKLELSDEGPWAGIVDGPPIRVFVCPTALDIVLSPWANLEDMRS